MAPVSHDVTRGSEGGMPQLGIDPITLEVIQNGLAAIVDEMALTVMRTAYSGVVKDALDYSTALCDRHGEVIAQGLTIVLHLGSFPSAVRHILEAYGSRVRPGDVYILNDPYGSGGIHLPDIYIIKPIFVSGALEAFACALAHHTDVGAWFRGATPRRRPRSFRKAFASRPSSCSIRTSRTRRSSPSWRRTCASPGRSWAICERRSPRCGPGNGNSCGLQRATLRRRCGATPIICWM